MLNKQQIDQLYASVLRIYQCKATAQDYDWYSSSAVFTDPISHCEGVDEVKSAFNALGKMFYSETLETSLLEEPRPDILNRLNIKEGDQLVAFNLKQRYTSKLNTTDMFSIVALKVRDEKVVEHHDMWHGEILSETHGFKHQFRRFNGWLMSKLVSSNVSDSQ